MNYHVVLVNPPYEAPWLGPNRWIRVPPDGYGGVQWCVAMLADGLLDLGCRVTVLGAPGSPSWHPKLHFPQAGRTQDISAWLASHHFDIVHDHSNGAAFDPTHVQPRPLIATHHMTGAPRHANNVVFVSYAQRTQANRGNAPVVRYPFNIARFKASREKDSYLLFMGRISPWKGAREAAAFARAARRQLILAGPAWEKQYFDEIRSEYSEIVKWVGEVGGSERERLLSRATAVLVLSQAVPGPWGDLWVEPGAVVVGDAAASGTPVIATSNGCLAEIARRVGVVIASETISESMAAAVLASLPSPADVRREVAEHWNHTAIAARYIELYKRAIMGEIF